MAGDLTEALTRFHREVFVPDVREIVRTEITPIREEMRSFRDDTNSHFDKTRIAQLQERVAELEAQL